MQLKWQEVLKFQQPSLWNGSHFDKIFKADLLTPTMPPGNLSKVKQYFWEPKERSSMHTTARPTPASHKTAAAQSHQMSHTQSQALTSRKGGKKKKRGMCLRFSNATLPYPWLLWSPAFLNYTNNKKLPPHSMRFLIFIRLEQPERGERAAEQPLASMRAREASSVWWERQIEAVLPQPLSLGSCSWWTIPSSAVCCTTKGAKSNLGVGWAHVMRHKDLDPSPRLLQHQLLATRPHARLWKCSQAAEMQFNYSLSIVSTAGN